MSELKKSKDEVRKELRRLIRRGRALLERVSARCSARDAQSTFNDAHKWNNEAVVFLRHAFPSGRTGRFSPSGDPGLQGLEMLGKSPRMAIRGFSAPMQKKITELESFVDELRHLNEPMDSSQPKMQDKETASPPATPPSQTVVYNLIGENPRVNIASHDHSSNVAVNITSEGLFEQIRQTISEQVQEEAERQALLERVAELERDKGKPSFAEKYTQFVALAANHMQLLAPFLPALAQLSGG